MSDSKSTEEKLHKLTGWYQVEQYWEYYPVSDETRLRKCALRNILPKLLPDYITPAYDLGFLLDKLPNFCDYKGDSGYLILRKELLFYVAAYELDGLMPISTKDKSPANALCKLLIELLEQGEIKQDV